MQIVKQFSVKKNHYHSVTVFAHNDLTIVAASSSTETHIHIAPARTPVRAYQGAYHLSDVVDVSQFVATIRVDVNATPRRMPTQAKIGAIAPFEQEGWVSQEYNRAASIPLPSHVAPLWLNLTCDAMQCILDTAFECSHTLASIRADISRRAGKLRNQEVATAAWQDDIAQKRAEYARTLHTDPVFVEYGIARVYAPDMPDAVPFAVGSAVVVLHPVSMSPPTIYSSPRDFVTRHGLGCDQ